MRIILDSDRSMCLRCCKDCDIWEFVDLENTILNDIRVNDYLLWEMIDDMDEYQVFRLGEELEYVYCRRNFEKLLMIFPDGGTGDDL